MSVWNLVDESRHVHETKTNLTKPYYVIMPADSTQEVFRYTKTNEEVNNEIKSIIMPADLTQGMLGIQKLMKK